MTKKLRRNFILIAMASVLAVLSLIIGIINILNYASVRNNADQILNTLMANGGSFGNPGDFNFDEPTEPNGEFVPYRKNRGGMDVETPFETRYITISINDGTYTVKSSQIAAISNDEAISMAKKIENNKSGYLDIYRYQTNNISDTEKLVIFIDCSKNLGNAKSFLIYSLIISASGLVAVFVLVFLLSGKVIKPIVEANEKQKRFITNAGHELKTPLTIISANNEMIELTQGESELTLAISKQIVRMTGMVKNLTSLARLDEGVISNQSLFNASLVLADLSEGFIQAFESKNKVLRLYIDENIEYKGDMNLIKELFSITLDNALKYSKTFCNVTLKKQGSKIIYKISNDALDIKEGNLNECFERFYRTDGSRASSVEGSGIGLSIAKEIVNLHKGSIKATGLSGNIFEIEAIL